MYRAIYTQPLEVARNQALHKQRLKQAKSVVDLKQPQEQLHLIANPKKHEMEEAKCFEIERENAILLAKMSNIMRNGACTHDVGGPPPQATSKPSKPKGQSLNRTHRKQELKRITQENLAILNRIQTKDPTYNHLEWEQWRREHVKYMRQHCVHPPPGTKKKESKFARQLRGQIGSETARGPRSRKYAAAKGSMTDRTRQSGGTHASPVRRPEERVAEALKVIRADDMRLLLGMKRPPEIVKKVFSALMIVVSPFETTEADVTWDAVHDWVRQLHGVDSFLDNLQCFDASSIPQTIVQKTLDFMAMAELYPATVRKFSGALATLCTWIWSACEAANPELTANYRHEQAMNRGQHGEEEAMEEEVPDQGVEETEQDYGFANGDTVGEGSRLPPVNESEAKNNERSPDGS